MSKISEKSSAILNMAGAAAMFSMMGITTRSLNNAIPTFEILFVRSIFGAFLIAAFLNRRGVKLRGVREKELIFRGAIGFVSASCFFFAMGHMKVADASVLIRSSALFVPFVAYIIVKENVRQRDIFISLAGFIGVGFVIKPGTSVFTFVSLIALLAAFSQSIAFASVRNLSSSEHPLRIVYYFLTISYVLSLILGFSDFVIPNQIEASKLLLIAVTGLVGQFLMTLAYSKSSAATITPVLNLELVFTILTAIVLFGEYPDIYSWVGMVIIILATLQINQKKIIT